MEIINSLVYRIQRLFFGERGIVVKVEPNSEEKKPGPDSFGNFPQNVTFRNPLGEEITKTPRKGYDSFRTSKSGGLYTHGQKFP